MSNFDMASCPSRREVQAEPCNGLTSVLTVDKFISKNKMQMIIKTQVTLQQCKEGVCECLGCRVEASTPLSGYTPCTLSCRRSCISLCTCAWQA